MEEIKPIVTAQLARYKPSALHTRTDAITALKNLLGTPGITKDEFTKALRAVKDEAAKDHNSHLSAKLFGRSSFLVLVLSETEKKIDHPTTLKDEKTAEHNVRLRK